VRVSEDRYSRDLHRIDIAKRMITHEVRTRWICMWTELSGCTVRNLYKSYVAGLPSAPKRRRGLPPTNPLVFVRNAALVDEGSVLAGLAYRFAIIPKEPMRNARKALARLEVAEQLCRSYELFRHVVPRATFSMEQYMVLIFALAEAQEVRLGLCEGCRGVLLIDCLGRSRRKCVRCRQAQTETAASENAPRSPPEMPDAVLQHSLF